MKGTVIQWYRAEFKRPLFAGPGTGAWEVIGHWEYQETLPYAIRTVVFDLLDSGHNWRELSDYDFQRAFPRGEAGGYRVDRAFVSAPGRQIITLTDKRRGLLKIESESMS